MAHTDIPKFYEGADWQAVLAHILTKSPSALTEWEREFIAAREPELTDEQKAAYLSGKKKQSADDAPAAEKQLDKMNLAELQAKAESLGLDTAGTKAQLIERITATPA